jgi:hypothetical protein
LRQLIFTRMGQISFSYAVLFGINRLGIKLESQTGRHRMSE